ncbi:MAG: energy transducer TonB [Bacteroidota bacterium]
MQQINRQKRPQHQLTPQLVWHLWAILAMIGVNYLVIVHVPQWVSWMETTRPEATTSVQIDWTPEVWEQELPRQSTPKEQNHAWANQSAVDVEPVPINLHQVKRRMEVPRELQGLQQTARVKVRILVDERGDYVKHRRPQHLYDILAQTVDEQVSELSFLPALRNGKPVPYWVEVRFVFEL